MILPSKHINLSESLFGLGGIILKILKNPMTLDDLWVRYSKMNNKKSLFPSYHSFDHVILALNYLFAIEVIDINDGDKIYIIPREEN